MSYKKIILPAAAVAVIIAAVASLSLRSSPPERGPEAPAEIEDRFDIKAEGVTHEARKDGRLAWTMEADDAGFSREDGKARIRNLRTELLGKDGSRITVTASTGIIDTANNDMVLTGDVRVKDGTMILMTDVLYYTDATRVIHTDTPVRIESEEMKISGDRLVFNLNTNITRLSGNVRGAFGAVDGK